MPNSTKTLSISLHSLDVSVRQCIYLLPGQLLRPRLLYNSTRRNPRLINRSLVIPGWVSLSMGSSPTWAYVSSPRPRTQSISVSRALQSPPTPLKHHVCWPVFTQKVVPTNFALLIWLVELFYAQLLYEIWSTCIFWTKVLSKQWTCIFVRSFHSILYEMIFGGYLEYLKPNTLYIGH